MEKERQITSFLLFYKNNYLQICESKVITEVSSRKSRERIIADADFSSKMKAHWGCFSARKF